MQPLKTAQNGIIERYESVVDDNTKFSEHIREPLKQSFRINTLKGDEDSILDKLREYDPKITYIPWSGTGYVSELTNLGSSLEHFTGQIYIQELTSMMPPLVVKDLIRGSTILDCCAAPGSKTTQIAAMMENKGHIIANDSRHARLKSLRGNLDRLGVTNTTVTLRDFKSFPNIEADLYLVDAPCSSEGTIRKKNTVARLWKEKDYERFSKLQKGLLNKACEMAPTDSTIIYSTCTFAPEENERVVHETIKEQPVEIQKIKIDGLKSRKGIAEWKNESYDKEVEKCMRIWPHHNDTGGFFVTRFKKC